MKISDQKTNGQKTIGEKLLKKAEKLYTIGTRFVSFEDNVTIREVQPYKNMHGIGDDNCTFRIMYNNDINKNIIIIRSDNGMFTSDINGKPVCSNPAVYKDGKWAKIIKSDVNDNFESISNVYLPVAKRIKPEFILDTKLDKFYNKLTKHFEQQLNNLNNNKKTIVTQYNYVMMDIFNLIKDTETILEKTYTVDMSKLNSNKNLYTKEYLDQIEKNEDELQSIKIRRKKFKKNHKKVVKNINKDINIYKNRLNMLISEINK